jgi:hypothetical protein
MVESSCPNGDRVGKTHLSNTSATPSVGATGWPRLVGPPGRRLGRSASRYIAVRDAGWPHGLSGTAAAAALVHGRAQARGRGYNASPNPVGKFAGKPHAPSRALAFPGPLGLRMAGASDYGRTRKTDARAANASGYSPWSDKHTRKTYI